MVFGASFGCDTPPRILADRDPPTSTPCRHAEEAATRIPRDKNPGLMIDVKNVVNGHLLPWNGKHPKI